MGSKSLGCFQPLVSHLKNKLVEPDGFPARAWLKPGRECGRESVQGCRSVGAPVLATPLQRKATSATVTQEALNLDTWDQRHV